MKRIFLATAFLLTPLLLPTSLFADIQSPPGGHYSPSHKLGRGIANVLYSPTEIPHNVSKTYHHTSSSSAAMSYGLVQGVKKTSVRIGHGFRDIFTFPARTRGSYKPTLTPQSIDYFHGYSDFPPEVGRHNRTYYVR